MKELSRQTKFCTKPSTPLFCQAQTVESTAGTDLLNGRNKGCQLLRILYSTAGCVQPKSQAKSGNHDIYNTAIHGQELSLCPSSKAWRVRLLSAVLQQISHFCSTRWAEPSCSLVAPCMEPASAAARLALTLFLTSSEVYQIPGTGFQGSLGDAD